MINQKEWLRTRRKLLEQVRAQVQARIGPMPAALRRYARTVEADFRQRWTPCGEREFLGALRAARVVLGADFHAYSQSQRAHVRILRDLVPKRRITLALECLSHEHDAVIDSFVGGKISESRFLSEVAWEKNWGFPWEHYRPLFDLARDRGIRVRGLNRPSVDSLIGRDRWASRRLERIHLDDPETLVYAVIGEWHLARRHLPRQVERWIPNSSDLLVLFQDVDSLYFRLAHRHREGVVDMLKAPGGRYCLMVSPPWMKWQSYLMFLEHAYDRDLQEDLAIDYSDHVVSLIEVLERDLGIETRKSKVQVYCPNSRTSLARLRLSLPGKMSRALVFHLRRDHSFYLPERDWFYLSRPTINHASALAGQFVHAQLSHRRHTLWNVPRNFLGLIWVEAVGFFFSKWINPKRKADSVEAIRVQLAAGAPRDQGRKALLLVLDHRLTEVMWLQTGRMRRKQFKPRRMDAYLEGARVLGGMLGERLFHKVRSQTISLRELMAYLRMDIEGGDFEAFYWNLIQELGHDQTP